MIDNLLKNDLPRAYGIQRPNVQLIYYQRTDAFELGDNVACAQCKENYTNNDCNEKVIKINARDYTITIVNHEDYINQFNGKQFAKGRRCDYMMVDADTHRKIVFCDLGCYSEKYVLKKQRDVQRQLRDSFKRFLDKPCGENFINQFVEKILIFGRRDRAINFDVSPTPASGNIKGNMQAFLTNPLSKSKYAESEVTINDTKVRFLIINYPEPYIW